MVYYSVDRIESGVAVLINGKEKTEFNVSNLPTDVREGDLLVKNSDGEFVIDKNKTEEIKNKLNSLQNALFDE